MSVYTIVQDYVIYLRSVLNFPLDFAHFWWDLFLSISFLSPIVNGVFFPIISSTWLLLVYKKAIDFCLDFILYYLIEWFN